jgi:hypothetical protein
MTDKPRYKGDIVQASVIIKPMDLYGVRTEWAVRFHVQSPTGDSSDFLELDIPAVSKNQACAIADRYNTVSAPEMVGYWDADMSEFDSVRQTA